MGERIRGGRATARALALVVVAALLTTVVPDERAAAQPAPATITATMTPATDLVDNMVVTVTGHGFAPNRIVGAAQCLGTGPTVDLRFCQARSSLLGVSDQNGDVTFRLVLDVVLYLPYLGGWIPVDCRTWKVGPSAPLARCPTSTLLSRRHRASSIRSACASCSKRNR